MAKKHEAERFLRNGLMPSQIASRLRISTGTAIQYLHTRIGEGAIRLSEIYFCLPLERREMLARVSEEMKKQKGLDAQFWQERGLMREDYEFYKPIRSRTVFAGDLYEHISETEIALHDLPPEGQVLQSNIPLLLRG